MPTKSFSSRTAVKRYFKKNTKEMVEEALLELHNKRGITLKQVYKFISTRYNLEKLTVQRMNIIKKHIKLLQETAHIVNITGRGLIGHLKLLNRTQAEIHFKHKWKNVAAKSMVTSRNPRHADKKSIMSMEETPLHSSTPFITNSKAPRGPEVRKRMHKSNGDTPRSSLPKKRNLLRLSKKDTEKLI